MPSVVRWVLLASLVLFSGCASNQTARQLPASDAPDHESVAPERASGFRVVPRVTAERHLAVAAHPLAAQAGAAALARGGSALDAALAAQAMLTLVEPQSSGIGGGAFLLYWDKSEDRLVAWDGRETAPGAAVPTRFLGDDGQPLAFPDAVVGGRSVGVPGVLRMLEAAHRAHGKLPWASAFDAAIERAEEGFPLSPRLYNSLATDAMPMPEPAASYLRNADGTPKSVGTVLENPLLAETLRLVQAEGADALYRGPIAEDVVATVQRHTSNADEADEADAGHTDGLLSLEDLAAYRHVEREAVCAPYRAHQVCGFPPPTSGGTTVLAILGMLARFELDEEPLSPRNAHLLAEASRLAYADRGVYVADPAFASVPTAGLISGDYLASRAGLIDPERALVDVQAGTPPRAPPASEGRALDLPSTSHLVMVDEDGDIACMTTSVEHVFGSHLMVRGFFLNNQLTDFAFRPTGEDGRPVANALEPHKRPRSSMAPTLVFTPPAEGTPRQPVLAVGSPGGSRIIGYVAQTVIGVLDHGLDVQDAIELPHVVSRGGPGGGLVEIEAYASPAEGIARLESGGTGATRADLRHLGEALSAMGHDVAVTELNSGLHAVQWKNGRLLAGADPRREGIGVGR